MVFSSTVFLFLFLPALLVLYYLFFPHSRIWRNAVLLTFSILFYAWGEPVFVVILLFSIFVNWMFVMFMERREERGRKPWMIAAIAYDTALLVVFKYASFLSRNMAALTGNRQLIVNITLPIGISFFTFQMMSYVFDVYYRRAQPQKNPLYVVLYISLFPQLIAGPIVRYQQIETEISRRSESFQEVSQGIRRFDHHQMYFKTDHHWLPETGLWAAREIVQKLNRACGFNFELSGIQDDDINKTVYPKHFLGSQGKKVTLAKAEPEDISLLYPDYDTEFHYEIMNLGVNTEGDFSIFYDMHYMEELDYYKGHPFAAYIYGNQPLEQIENRRLDNGKRLLVIHDSYALPVIPFLALKAQYVDAIDPRYFDGSLRTYIERTKPDAVIVLYNAAELANPAMYNFK